MANNNANETIIAGNGSIYLAPVGTAYPTTPSAAVGLSMSGTLTSASTSVTVASTTGITAGMSVTGTGIPAGATVASVTNATTFVLSIAATASGAQTLAISAWTMLGLISEDGVKLKPSQDVKDFGSWQSLYAVRSIVTSRGLDIGFTLLQWNRTNLITAFGGGSITAVAPYKFVPPATGDVFERAVLLRTNDGTKKYDIGIARVTSADLGEIGLMRTEISGLQIAFRMLDDGDPATDPFQILTDDPAFA
jgi:hypothetical protein